MTDYTWNKESPQPFESPLHDVDLDPEPSGFGQLSIVKTLNSSVRAPYILLGVVYYIILVVLSFPIIYQHYNLLRDHHFYPILWYLLVPLVLVSLSIATERSQLHTFSWFIFSCYILWLATSLLWVAFFFDQEYIKDRYMLLPPQDPDRSLTLGLAILSLFLIICLLAYTCSWLLIIPLIYSLYQIYISINF